MELKKKSFILHVDNLNVIDEMTDEQAGKLLKAMNAFHKGEEIELDPLTKMAFSFFKAQFIRDNEKYIKTCEARAQAGSKGGKQKQQNIANASKCYQKVAKVADSDSDSDSDSDKNIKDHVTSQKQPHWDFEKCKEIWNEEKEISDCPATGCKLIPDSFKNGLPKIHKKYQKYCKDSGKSELERHDWFRAYAKGHLKRCSSFVGNSDKFSWKPSIKDLAQAKTFEALINQ